MSLVRESDLNVWVPQEKNLHKQTLASSGLDQLPLLQNVPSPSFE